MTAHERERLAGWIDGELTPDERAAVEAHVAGCAECATLLADMGAVDGLARALPLEAPEGYFDSFPTRVRSRIEASRARSRRAGWRPPAWTWAAAAALVLGVVTPLTIARLGREEAPRALRVGPTAKDQPETEGRVPAAPASGPEVVTPTVAEPGLSDLVATRAGPAAPIAAEPSEALRQADNKAEESGGGRAGSVEGFAPAPGGEPAAHPPAWEDTPAYALEPPGPAETGPTAVAEDAAVAAPSAKSLTEEFDLPSRAPRRQPAPAKAGTAAERRATETPVTSAGAAMDRATDRRRRESALASAGTMEGEEEAFAVLDRESPAGAAAWREHREAWRAFVGAYPVSPRVDAARLRVIQAGLEAWRAGGDPEDLAGARADAEAYLARDDAQDKQAVRALLRSLEER